MGKRPIGQFASIIIGQERAALTAALDKAAESFHSPAHGSPRAIDRNMIALQPEERRENLEGLSIGLVHDAYNQLRSLDQYAQAIANVLTADSMLPLPAASMVRSIHEGALALARLVDSSLSPQERIARMGAFQLENAQGALNALASFGTNYRDEEEEVREKLSMRHAYMGVAGYDIHFKPNKPLLADAVTWGGAKSSLQVNVTAASSLYMPKSHYSWVLGSGATHNRLWYSDGLSGEWETIVVGAVAPLLDVSDLLVDKLLGYLGVEGEPLHESTHRRRRALMGRVLPDTQSTYADYQKA